jgi:HTH-type transcriptional regulator / antitoxin HigA
MLTLKYKVIKSRKQYFEYCGVLDELVSKKMKSQRLKDEVELLTVLIEKWDKDHSKFENADPISLLKFLLQQHTMTAQDLAKLLRVSKGLVSDMLNYKKGLSKETIRNLAEIFKTDQAAFNQPYTLKNQ